MSTIDKFINFMRVNNEEDEQEDGYADEYATDDYPEEAPAVPREDPYSDPEDRSPRKVTKATPFRSRKATKETNMSNASNMEVFVLKPNVLDDAAQAVDALLDGRSVVLNLDNLVTNQENSAYAQRIFDYVKGATYALNGRMEAISKFVFIITPETTNISGDIDPSSSEDSAIPSSGNLF
ncbi:MAG: cell division protein SepF [Lachnospiraceae bacterium]|nr:cell division protein SepF [Lachnospiraceae bacterium]